MSIFKRFGKRSALLAIIGSLIVAGSAMAYFLAHGTAAGNGGAVVGGAPHAIIHIADATVAGDPLVPGGS